MSLTGDPRRWANEPGIPGVVHVLDPYHGIQRGWDRTEDALAALEEVIQLEGPATIAGFILETVTGTNGILVPPDGYLKGVRDLCTKYGILMICDEVMAGFGRTGRWFAVDHWNVVPDLSDDGQGADQRLCAARRGRNAPSHRRSFPRSGVCGRPDLQQSPAGVRRGARDDRSVRTGRSHRQCPADGRRSWPRVSPGSPTAIRVSARSARSASSVSSSWSAIGRPWSRWRRSTARRPRWRRSAASFGREVSTRSCGGIRS